MTLEKTEDFKSFDSFVAYFFLYLIFELNIRKATYDSNNIFLAELSSKFESQINLSRTQFKFRKLVPKIKNFAKWSS